MSISQIKGDKVDVKIWSPLDEVEPGALAQLKNVASLPWVFHHVAVMADVHIGKGCTIGSVIALRDAVSPAACGVDVGCGMMAVETNITANDLPDSLKQLRHSIERGIPVGFNWHKDPVKRVEKLNIWDRFKHLDKKVQDLKERALLQCGTMGGGNHFLELCLDEAGGVWLMLHSGSRNIGKTLADIHIKVAKKLAHNSDLPDPDLAVFLSGTPEMEAYRRDLYWAQEYALENRKTMMAIYQDQMKRAFPQIIFEKPIQCHHNYVSEEYHYGENVFITRKGAIRAGQGDMGIIPGSMGACSYIVRGLGNPESFESASHGAGRRMSRGEARRTFTVKDLEEQTKGVECRKDSAVLDEIPSAYKDIDKVMENQKDLVEIVAKLKQIMCIKGGGRARGGRARRSKKRNK